MILKLVKKSALNCTMGPNPALDAMIMLGRVAGKVARWPLKMIPPGMAIPVLQGPNRGYRWIAGSLTHGCWLGSYERANLELLSKLVSPGMTVYDVGANAGYFSLMFSRRTGPAGKVVAFEPEPRNIRLLEKHLKINSIKNVEIVEAAVSDRAATAYFAGTHAQGRLSSSGVLQVKTVKLDDFPAPDLIKMDIEGAEGLAIAGALEVLDKQKTIWFIEVHGSENGPRIAGVFAQRGYTMKKMTERHLMAFPKNRR